MLKKENAVEALLASSGRFAEDELIQRMASKAVVNLSQTAGPDDTKTDPAIPTNEIPVRSERVLGLRPDVHVFTMADLCVRFCAVACRWW